MVLPLLAGLSFGLFSIVKIAKSRMKAIEAARYETWNKFPLTKSNQPMALNNPIDDGAAEHIAIKSEDIDGWWGGTYPSESRNKTLAGTWDHNEVPFNTGQRDFLPHLNVVSEIAEQAGFRPVFWKSLPTP